MFIYATSGPLPMVCFGKSTKMPMHLPWPGATETNSHYLWKALNQIRYLEKKFFGSMSSSLLQPVSGQLQLYLWLSVNILDILARCLPMWIYKGSAVIYEPSFIEEKCSEISGSTAFSISFVVWMLITPPLCGLVARRDIDNKNDSSYSEALWPRRKQQKHESNAARKQTPGSSNLKRRNVGSPGWCCIFLGRP